MAGRRQRGEDGQRSRRRVVLVVGTDDWGVQQAVDHLAGSGMVPLTCHPCGEPAFPCNALVEGRVCPLDVGIDIAVTVRARPEALPTAGEQGITCALHEGIPVVTAGIAGRNPFAPWAARAVGRGDDLAVVVEDVLRDAELAEHHADRHRTDIDLRPAVAGEPA